ncbi:Pancreatic triacylglycerol lipase [Halotydeus destructor]|nr:Pancreatic triacylglycerol lipase [Halotydeus destructor]
MKSVLLVIFAVWGTQAHLTTLPEVASDPLTTFRFERPEDNEVEYTIVTSPSPFHVYYGTAPPATGHEAEVTATVGPETDAPTLKPTTEWSSSPDFVPTTLSSVMSNTESPSVPIPTRQTPLTSNTTLSPPTSTSSGLDTTTDNYVHDPVAVKFLLYTRKHPDLAIGLIPGKQSIVQSLVYYKPTEPTRFIVHSSFDGPVASSWMRNMKNKLLLVEDSNVILVDWSKGASASMIDQRMTHVHTVGLMMVKTIEDLMSIQGTKPEDIHIIAHSFGTFAADVVGRKIKNIGRISGLDPGSPGFETLRPDERLDPTDAIFVDVIHTDSQNGSVGTPLGSLYGRGTLMPVGHVDFYPNGGSDQPGCSLQRFEDLITRPIGDGIRRFVACHHYRSIDYYLDSIVPTVSACAQLAHLCDNYTNFLDGKCAVCSEEESGHTCAQMGFRANLAAARLKATPLPKKLYLTTNRRKPFCLYHYNIEVKVSETPDQLRGGVLLLRIVGENGQMETRINGGMTGFPSGQSTYQTMSHHMDIGVVKSLSLAWLPAPTLNLFSDPTVHIAHIKITPLSLLDPKVRQAMTRILCPSSDRGDAIGPFYRETFFTATEVC